MAEFLASEVEKKMTLPPSFKCGSVAWTKKNGPLTLVVKWSSKKLLVDILQSLRPHNPSVQSQDIDPSKGLEGLIQEMLARFHSRDISLDGDRCTTAEAVDLVGDLLRGCFVGGIVYDNGGTILSQTLSDGCTDGSG